MHQHKSAITEKFEFKVFENPFDETNHNDIFAINALIYEEYYGGDKAKVLKDDPVNYQVVHNPNKPDQEIVVDDEILRSKWFGIYRINDATDEKKLIACARAVLPDVDGKTELHRYLIRDDNKHVLDHVVPSENMIELNRCAVQRNYQGHGIAALLLFKVLEYFKGLEKLLITTTPNETLQALYRTLEFQEPEKGSFFYNKGETKQAQLYLILPEMQSSAITALVNILKNKRQISVEGNIATRNMIKNACLGVRRPKPPLESQEGVKTDKNLQPQNDNIKSKKNSP